MCYYGACALNIPSIMHFYGAKIKMLNQQSLLHVVRFSHQTLLEIKIILI